MECRDSYVVHFLMAISIITGYVIRNIAFREIFILSSKELRADKKGLIYSLFAL